MREYLTWVEKMKRGYGGCYGAIDLLGNSERCNGCGLKDRCEKKSKEATTGLGALFG